MIDLAVAEVIGEHVYGGLRTPEFSACSVATCTYTVGPPPTPPPWRRIAAAAPTASKLLAGEKFSPRKGTDE